MFLIKISLINLLAILLVISTNAIEISLPIVHPNQIGLSEKRLENIDKTFNELIENKEIPGAVVVISRYGKVGYLKAFGMLIMQSN